MTTFADNGGTRIAYRAIGTGSPLVLLHGWSCEGRYRDEFGYVSQLADQFQVVVPDLRSHGMSDIPVDGDYSDTAWASDVIAVLDDLEIEKTSVFGYSLGGWVALEMLSRHASRLNACVIGGAHPYDDDLSDARNLTPNMILELWTSAEAPLSDDSKDRILAFDQQVLVDCLPDRVDQTDRLKGINTPWVTICGTEDWRHPDMKRFGEENQHFKFVDVPSQDHLGAWLQSAYLAPMIVDFLGKSTPAQDFPL